MTCQFTEFLVYYTVIKYSLHVVYDIKMYSFIEGKVDAVTFATGTGGTLAGIYICTYFCYTCFLLYQKLVNCERA